MAALSALSQDELNVLADAYAFIGNSLLKPMSMTESIGLDPGFWEAFPDLGSDDVARAKADLVSWAVSQAEKDRDQAIEDVSVEYTRLFIGPPSPAAAPWETMYGETSDGSEITVGFGTPTFQMRELLRGIGLELSNENNQYEDHIGIELLYLSELCRSAAKTEPGSPERNEAVSKIEGFISEHPAKWTDRLCSKVGETYPDGYIVRLLKLAKAFLAI